MSVFRRWYLLKFRWVLCLYLICFVQFFSVSRRKINHVLCCQWFPLLTLKMRFLLLKIFLPVLLKKCKTKKAPTYPNKIKQPESQVTLDWENVSLLALWWLFCPLIVLADVSLDFIFSLILSSVILLMAQTRHRIIFISFNLQTHAAMLHC